MIVKNQYPICEFDTNKNPIIHPTNFLTENLPKKCVITYLRKELEHFCKENKLKEIDIERYRSLIERLGLRK